MAISMTDLQWAAGFLEGEGSFSAVSAGKRKDGRPRMSFNASVNAGQVNTEPLLRLQSIFGGSIYRHNMHTGHPCWRWQLCGKRGVGLMMTMWTMMSGKRREQIEDAIAKWKTNLSYKEAAPRGDAWRAARGR